MIYLSSVKSILCNLPNVPFLSHLTPRTRLILHRALICIWFSLLGWARTRECPAPITPRAPLSVGGLQTAAAAARSAASCVAKKQRNAAGGWEPFLGLQPRVGVTPWLPSMPHLSQPNVSLTIFSKIAAPFLNIPDKCNLSVPPRAVSDGFKMCFTLKWLCHVGIHGASASVYRWTDILETCP